jgi:hypothetical protein
MGREELIKHIETELSGKSDKTTEPQEITDALCQHCGVIIETEGSEPDDYVVHSIPSHGESGRSFVFYCGPDCFQNAIDELLDV